MADQPEKPAEKVSPLPLAAVYANQMAIQATATDVTIIFHRLHPAVGEDGILRRDVGIPQVSAVVQMSPQAAKDLALAVQDTVEKLEKEFGKFSTPFTIKAEAEKK